MRHKQGFGWVMSLVCHVASLFDQQKQRMTFLFAVIDMFREIIVDIHEFGAVQLDLPRSPKPFTIKLHTCIL